MNNDLKDLMLDGATALLLILAALAVSGYLVSCQGATMPANANATNPVSAPAVSGDGNQTSVEQQTTSNTKQESATVKNVGQSVAGDVSTIVSNMDANTVSKSLFTGVALAGAVFMAMLLLRLDVRSLSDWVVLGLSAGCLAGGLFGLLI